MDFDLSSHVIILYSAILNLHKYCEGWFQNLNVLYFTLDMMWRCGKVSSSRYGRVGNVVFFNSSTSNLGTRAGGRLWEYLKVDIKFNYRKYKGGVILKILTRRVCNFQNTKHKEGVISKTIMCSGMSWGMGRW